MNEQSKFKVPECEKLYEILVSPQRVLAENLNLLSAQSYKIRQDEQDKAQSQAQTQYQHKDELDERAEEMELSDMMAKFQAIQKREVEQVKKGGHAVKGYTVEPNPSDANTQKRLGAATKDTESKDTSTNAKHKGPRNELIKLQPNEEEQPKQHKKDAADDALLDAVDEDDILVKLIEPYTRVNATMPDIENLSDKEQQRQAILMAQHDCELENQIQNVGGNKLRSETDTYNATPPSNNNCCELENSMLLEERELAPLVDTNTNDHHQRVYHEMDNLKRMANTPVRADIEVMLNSYEMEVCPFPTP